ncbi:MAG: flagellar motor protein MotB [Defluviitaleaceae bacterium]|nr:flagellar motor protein MotB [Defluviitaleaceae bacterium]
MKEKKKEQGAKMVLPGWFASYADMVTVLMVFFILLFTMAQVDEAKFQEFLQGIQGDNFGRGMGESIFEDSSMFEHPPPPADPLIPIPTPNVAGELPPDTPVFTQGQIAAIMANSFRTYLAPYDVTDTPGQPGDVGIFVPEDASYVRVVMYDRAHFQPGQPVLLPPAIGMIDRMAPAILDYAQQGHTIVVEGHADNVPMAPGSPYVDNWGLSSQRASSVVRHLVNVWGIPAHMIQAVGMGEHHPIDTNNTPEGRANNRRVEIKIFTTVSETTTRPAPVSPFTIPGL